MSTHGTVRPQQTILFTCGLFQKESYFSQLSKDTVTPAIMHREYSDFSCILTFYSQQAVCQMLLQPQQKLICKSPPNRLCRMIQLPCSQTSASWISKFKHLSCLKFPHYQSSSRCLCLYKLYATRTSKGPHTWSMGKLFCAGCPIVFPWRCLI